MACMVAVLAGTCLASFHGNDTSLDPYLTVGAAPQGFVMDLSCQVSFTITNITFASYGTPVRHGPGNYTTGECHASNSERIVAQRCLRRAQCRIVSDNLVFNSDPCLDTKKKLVVVALCTPSGNGTAAPLASKNMTQEAPNVSDHSTLVSGSSTQPHSPSK